MSTHLVSPEVNGGAAQQETLGDREKTQKHHVHGSLPPDVSAARHSYQADEHHTERDPPVGKMFENMDKKSEKESLKQFLFILIYCIKQNTHHKNGFLATNILVPSWNVNIAINPRVTVNWTNRIP